MKTTTIGLLLLFLVRFSFAQSFQPTVTGSAGNDASFANGTMAWTIGEVMTETYSSATNFFTQGFLQPDTVMLVSINDFFSPGISIFPNPVIQNLFLDFGSIEGDYSLEIFDSQGKLLYKKQLSASVSPIKISFIDFANGIYILNLTSQNENKKSSYKIIKSE